MYLLQLMITLNYVGTQHFIKLCLSPAIIGSKLTWSIERKTSTNSAIMPIVPTDQVSGVLAYNPSYIH